jgi:hypothetical protein
VPAPKKYARHVKASSVLEAILSILNGRAATLTPGTIVGASVYLQTGQVRQALMACILGPPAVAGGKVLAEWVKLMEPPKHLRRPRRRGS